MKLFFVLLLMVSINVSADDYLIQEMESLKSSLSYNDPARNELNLRLADLYFEASIGEGGDQSKRKTALQYYENALYGKEGLTQVQNKLKPIVEFQVARLYNKLSKSNKAISHFTSVFQSDFVTQELKRESAFKLAEIFETKNQNIKAKKMYLSAIDLCNSVDSCNLAHYKLSWLHYKNGDYKLAISSIEKSLWDSRKQIRDEVLKDYILFLSSNETDGLTEYDKIERLAAKINRVELVRQLAEAYFANANFIAGSYFFEKLNNKTQNTYFIVRLLEHNYGIRNIVKMNHYLSMLKNRPRTSLPKNEQEAKEMNKILRRFVVQIDSESQTNKEFTPTLLTSIDTYLHFYQNDDLRLKMQQGWLKAQNNDELKLQRLALWIKEDLSLKRASDEIIKFRKSRLSIAQKLKISDIIISEALAIASESEKESREFRYIAARELYSLKEYKKALALFKPLSAIPEDKKVDKWAILSQNLTLDIYNQNKDYKSLITQADSWLNTLALTKDSQLLKELKEMRQVKTQARFENAILLGETSEALDLFFTYCMEGVYPKKSCPNAKVLSVKLKDQPKLVTLLEKEGDERALMNEYEAMGRFADAAKLQEKFNLNKNADYEVYLKISMLYELDQDFNNRDRILRKLISKIKRGKKIDEKLEGAIYLTLDEANMINHSTLSLPWSLNRKLNIAHRLESQKPSVKTQKLLLSQKEFVGPVWSKLVLNKIIELDKKQEKIGFYGRRSERNFKRRTRALDKLVSYSNEYLEGANAETRVYILDILKNAYLKLSNEVLSTPLPEGLDDETLMMVNQKLTTMSSPFEETASKYQELIQNELKQITDQALVSIINNRLAQTEKNYLSFFIVEEKENDNSISMSFNKYNQLKEQLRLSPLSREVLSSMQKFYKDNHNKRLAAYFTGRINSLKN
jgi:hypothetical protein